MLKNRKCSLVLGHLSNMHEALGVNKKGEREAEKEGGKEGRREGVKKGGKKAEETGNSKERSSG